MGAALYESPLHQGDRLPHLSRPCRFGRGRGGGHEQTSHVRVHRLAGTFCLPLQCEGQLIVNPSDELFHGHMIAVPWDDSIERAACPIGCWIARRLEWREHRFAAAMCML